MSNLMNPLPPLVSRPLYPHTEPCGSLAAPSCLSLVSPMAGLSNLQAVPLGEKPASATPAASRSGRCSVKGCVFPVSLRGHVLCRYHELFQSDAEAQHFQSHQPTLLFSLYAPCDAFDQEPNDSRQQDRRRQAEEREAFLLEDAA